MWHSIYAGGVSERVESYETKVREGEDQRVEELDESMRVRKDAKAKATSDDPLVAELLRDADG